MVFERTNDVSLTADYKYLEDRPRSNYRQLWVKGRHMRAEVLYRHTVGPERRSPEEVAEDYQLPLEAVLEAVEYCLRHKALLDSERSREETRLRESGVEQPAPTPTPSG